MKSKSLMKRAEEARQEIEKAHLELQKIQNECSHPKEVLSKEHGSDTGNYDPSQDAYWTDFKCGVCGKQWTEDGSK
jgi:hypothetical protein